MSHFTVLVIGEDVEGQLAPYHEYECTGIDNEYVIDVDKTEEAREEYESKTRSMIETPDGEQIPSSDERFYREPTPAEVEEHGINGRFLGGHGGGGGISWASREWSDGKGYRTKIHFVPEGHKEVDVPIKETMSFLEFMHYWYSTEESVLRPGEKPGETHRYQRLEVDENDEVIRYIDRTNPNAKWDWYVVGGRWTGYFPLKPGADGGVGQPGLMTEPAKKGYADSVRKGDVDIDRARQEAENDAIERFEKWEAVFKKHGKAKGWGYFRGLVEREEGVSIDEARELYHDQDAIKIAKKELGIWGCPVDAYGFDRAAYVQRCRNGALVPFAVVKDGKWHERGSMGWWGMVSDEKDESEWAEQSARLLDDLPDDTLLTLVDCHI